MKLVDFLKRTLNREQFETMVVWKNIGIIKYSENYTDYRLMNLFSGREIVLRIDCSENSLFPLNDHNSMYAAKDTATLLLVAGHLLDWDSIIIPESLENIKNKIKSDYSYELEDLDRSALLDFRKDLTDDATGAYEDLKQNNMRFFDVAKEKASALLVKSGLIKVCSDWKQKAGSMHSDIILSVGKKVHVLWVSSTRGIVIQSDRYVWSDDISTAITSDELAKMIYNTIFSWYGEKKRSDEKQDGK